MEKKLYEEMKKNKQKMKDKRNIFRKGIDLLKKVDKKILLYSFLAILLIVLSVLYFIHKPKVYKTDNIVNWSIKVDDNFEVNVIEDKLFDEIEVKKGEAYFAVIGQKFYGSSKKEYMNTQKDALMNQDGKKLKNKKISKYTFEGVEYVKDEKKQAMYFTVVKDRILKVEITFDGNKEIDKQLENMLDSVKVKINKK